MCPREQWVVISPGARAEEEVAAGKAQTSLRSLQLYWEPDPTTHYPGDPGTVAGEAWGGGLSG